MFLLIVRLAICRVGKKVGLLWAHAGFQLNYPVFALFKDCWFMCWRRVHGRSLPAWRSPRKTAAEPFSLVKTCFSSPPTHQSRRSSLNYRHFPLRNLQAEPKSAVGKAWLSLPSTATCLKRYFYLSARWSSNQTFPITPSILFHFSSLQFCSTTNKASTCSPLSDAFRWTLRTGWVLGCPYSLSEITTNTINSADLPLLLASSSRMLMPGLLQFIKTKTKTKTSTSFNWQASAVVVASYELVRNHSKNQYRTISWKAEIKINRKTKRFNQFYS